MNAKFPAVAIAVLIFHVTPLASDDWPQWRGLLFLTTDSQLVVAALDGRTFRELRRYSVAESAIYAHPAVLRDRIVIRDATHVASWRIE